MISDSAAGQSDGAAPMDASEQPQSRPRRGRPVIEPIELDPDIIANPEKMNFALLLALLMRHGGEVLLTGAELERTEQFKHCNILFALSLDGKQLAVSVVSSESGLIRSPEAPKWAPHQEQTPNYVAPPQPNELDAQALAMMSGWTPPSSPQQTAAGPMRAPDPGRIVEMPAPGMGTPPPAPPTPAGTAPAKPQPVFTFEVGPTPSNAQPMDLDALQNNLLSKDRQLAEQESRAVARVEQQR
jgi:hypothetical protein